MADGEDLLCWECVSDNVLRQRIRDEGHAGACSFCGKRRIACPLSDVADKVDGAIREFYRPGEQRAHIVPDNDNPQYWEDGEPATEIIQEIAGVEPVVAEALDELLSGAEARDVRDGGYAYYGDVPLEHIDAYPGEFMDIWLRFEERLKHEVRFFDEEGKRLLDELFADLPNLAGGRAIVLIEPGTEFSTFHRARIVDSDSDTESFIREPGRHLGPPPPHLARAGRMNPAGIPAFYAAFSEEVAVAEVRPPVGATVAIGRFSLLRRVRVLDVSFLPFAFHEESIFSPAYDRLRNKVGFLEKFHRRISRPVLPSDEVLAYLPTQAVAAYVTNVMGLDGMIYASTQVGAEGNGAEQADRRQCNIALFGAAAIIASVRRVPVHPPDDVAPLPPGAFPGFIARHGDAVVAPAPVPDEANAELPLGPAGAEDGIDPHEGAATLRPEPQPNLVKIRSVRVETSPMFAHLYDDGSVIINDLEDDDE